MAVIEIVTFGLAADVEEGEFLEADSHVQTEFAYRQHGVLRRTTARGAARQWVVVTMWASPADADASAGAAGSDTAVARLRACFDPSSVVSTRYSTLD